jgi:hypothetical protein
MLDMHFIYRGQLTQEILDEVRIVDSCTVQLAFPEPIVKISIVKKRLPDDLVPPFPSFTQATERRCIRGNATLPPIATKAYCRTSFDAVLP